MVVVWDRVTVDRMGVIALRTRALTDDAFPGHASSHGQLMHRVRPGTSSRHIKFHSRGDNHSGNWLPFPTRLPESGDAKSYALMCLLNVQHTDHVTVLPTEYRTSTDNVLMHREHASASLFEFS